MMKQTLIMIAAIVLFLVAGSLAVQQCTKRVDAEGERDLALAAYDSCERKGLHAGHRGHHGSQHPGR